MTKVIVAYRNFANKSTKTTEKFYPVSFAWLNKDTVHIGPVKQITATFQILDLSE
jgi:hypothetical protein